jgi:glucose-6-phosphate 1-epimerase
VQVTGLEGIHYLDKTDGGSEKTQAGAVTVTQEVDRVYTDVTAPELVINDASLARRIGISTEGSKTTIVWNPWIEIAKNMADLDDLDYLQFICVETANAADDVVTIAPGASAQLTVNYRVE